MTFFDGGITSLTRKSARVCATGDLTGAGCQKAATNAIVTATAANVYTNTVGYAADAGPGFNDPDNPFYLPDPVTGQQPVSTFGQNVIGFNGPGSIGSQDGAISQTLNKIPFVNAAGGLHDWIFNTPDGTGNAGLLPQTNWNNIWTMGAVAIPSIAASLNNPNISWVFQNGAIINTNAKVPTKPVTPGRIQMIPNQLIPTGSKP